MSIFHTMLRYLNAFAALSVLFYIYLDKIEYL